MINESEIYYRGEFEYSQPGLMAFSDDNKFCIRPAFASEYKIGRDNGG